MEQKRKQILIRLPDNLLKEARHAQIDSKHSSMGRWIEEAIREKLERDQKGNP